MDHTGSLRIDKEKMSKSLKNFVTIKDALEINSPEVLRLFLISSHYRSPLNYSEVGLNEAKNSLDRLYNSLQDLDYETKEYFQTKYSDKFRQLWEMTLIHPQPYQFYSKLLDKLIPSRKK